MNQGNHCGWINHRLISSLTLLALASVLLAACGSGSTTSASTSSSTTGSMNMDANSNMNMQAACDQMTKVTISEHTTPGKADQYFFTPDHVTINAGEFITFNNQSDEVHVLLTTPDAKLAMSAIDRNEDQPVRFTKAGVYTLVSQDAKHRATMQVTVTSATGTTCGISAPGTTITFEEKQTQGQPDLYTLTPKAVSIKAGQSLALLNKTDQALNFSCKPSADMTEGNLRIDPNEQQVVQFVKAGQYSCTSTTAPMTTIAINVH